MKNDEGFLDLQLNGYAGIDWNKEALSAEELHKACQLLKDEGVSGFLATIITEKLDLMVGRLARMVELREQDELIKEMIPGFHIEGPFINATKGYRGAHPEDSIIPADVETTKLLLDAAAGLTKILTLAPENDEGMKTTKFLADSGITVSAGHCNPSMDDLTAAVDSGLSMFTHLGNGTPVEMPRHDNILQRVLSLSDKIWCCFIADGAHLPWHTLRNCLKCAGLDRSVIVTDAMSAAGLGKGRFTVGRWELNIGDDMVARSPDGSHLVGAVITMKQSVNNLIEHAGLTEDQARQLTVTNPRKAVGL